MVYLTLSVGSIDSAMEYYADKLGFFDRVAGRLMCNLGVDLILDLEEIGSERHFNYFGQNKHVVSKFRIHIGGDLPEVSIPILDYLNRNSVEYKETINIAGHFLEFIDPSGNSFGVHAHNSVIE
ncbi:hypothetical protein [Saccharophagus degradans]|uniref:VOC domain-containing protein n=1 Tax=Saccharophagus degradans TaxID=86304 RepID=A0AAW7X769_9GAMM|nr:hypothetical protein [Saccharophagus degradans]MDO6423513.1 hypothetical protein [Saccharophagus degradans]MDO6606918.1 hypothetical protein [Saccharophagus degradans]WGO98145.1 hypothetical protein QFX18_19240 [Saccharophagus degradans]